ncbi:MAG: glycoside hydrolase [Clostridia bacterium]|nr:glycoside hydrolase [Clostridia bacterium]
MKADLTEILYEKSRPIINSKELEVLDESTIPDQYEWDVIGIYPEFEYQSFEGFGTALTDSACWLLTQMPGEEKQKAIKAWFGKGGVNAVFIRASIDSCDYSLEEYQAVSDPVADPGLDTFSIEHDKKYMIPIIKEAIALSDRDIRVMMSPWSPPYQWKTAPMKPGTRGVTDETAVDIPSRNYGGSLKPEYYGAWAKYIVKYILAYINEGVPVDMLTLQNESYAITEWDSCFWTADAQKVFLRDHLYPGMKEAGLAGKVRIFAWDHNKERILENLGALIDDDTAGMIDGVAYHWYSGDHFDVLRMVGEKYPKLPMIHSESCALHIPDGKSDFTDGIKYARDMIGDLNNGMHGFIDWNLTVDRKGGPRHVPDGFSAPIVTEDDGKVTFTLSYEYIKLFSRTVPPGSIRIGSSTCDRDLETAAVRRPDGGIGIIIYSLSDKEEKIHIRCSGKAVNMTVKPGSFNSIIL